MTRLAVFHFYPHFWIFYSCRGQRTCLTQNLACNSWLALSYLVFLAHVLTDRTLVSLRTKWIKTVPCCRQSSWLASMLHLHTRNLQCDSKWRLLWSQSEAWLVDSSLNYAKDKVHVNILDQKELSSFAFHILFLYSYIPELAWRVSCVPEFLLIFLCLLATSFFAFRSCCLWERKCRHSY